MGNVAVAGAEEPHRRGDREAARGDEIRLARCSLGDRSLGFSHEHEGSAADCWRCGYARERYVWEWCSGLIMLSRRREEGRREETSTHSNMSAAAADNKTAQGHRAASASTSTAGSSSSSSSSLSSSSSSPTRGSSRGRTQAKPIVYVLLSRSLNLLSSPHPSPQPLPFPILPQLHPSVHQSHVSRTRKGRDEVQVRPPRGKATETWTTREHGSAVGQQGCCFSNKDEEWVAHSRV